MTRNLYRTAVPSIKSLLANSDVDTIYLLIEDDVYPFDLPKIKVINVSDQQYISQSSPNYYGTPWTYMVMMRACLCKYIKAARCLSLDVDTIVDGDISDLWELPMNDYYLAGGREPDKSGSDIYVNLGVVMFNLSKLKKDGKADEIIEALNTRTFGFLEQDAFNEFCRGKIYELPPEYNVHYWSVKTDKKPVIHHFAGIRADEWIHKALVQHYDAMEV